MTIIDVWNYIKSSFQYLLKKWKLIVIVGLTGGVIGLTLSFVIKPTYTARLSFSLIEGGGKGGLMDLASNLGFASLLNSGNDVLVEIICWRHEIETCSWANFIVDCNLQGSGNDLNGGLY